MSSSLLKDGASQRLSLLEEMVESEGKYVGSLRTIVESFVPQVKEKIIFGNVCELYEIHKVLLEKLVALGRSTRAGLHKGRGARSVLADAEATLARTFLEMAPFLKAASRYCSNYGQALAVMPKIGHISKDGVDLPGYLVKPMQRITKYPLFFKDLARLSESNGEVLGEALAAVENVAETVNKAMDGARVVDIFQNGFDAHESLGTLVTPSRRFHLEGRVAFRLRRKIHNNTKTTTTTTPPQRPTSLEKKQSGERRETTPLEHRVQYFLFNDLFLVAAIHPEKPQKYRLRFRFDLVDLAVLEAIDVNEDVRLFLRYQATIDGGSYAFETGPDLQRATQTIDFQITTDTPAECDTLRAALRTNVQRQKEIRHALQGRRSRRF